LPYIKNKVSNYNNQCFKNRTGHQTDEDTGSLIKPLGYWFIGRTALTTITIAMCQDWTKHVADTTKVRTISISLQQQILVFYYIFKLKDSPLTVFFTLQQTTKQKHNNNNNSNKFFFHSLSPPSLPSAYFLCTFLVFSPNK
jgi:hypothetical protein